MALTWLVSGFGEKSVCNNSWIVKKLAIRRSSGQTLLSIPKCGWGQRGLLSSDVGGDQWLSHISDIIQDLETLNELTSLIDIKAPINLTISWIHPLQWEAKDHHLSLGIDLVRDIGHFSHALMRMQMLLGTRDSQVDQRVWSELAIDATWEVFASTHNLINTSKNSKNRNHIFWPNFILDSQVYCQSPFVKSHQIKDCEPSPPREITSVQKQAFSGALTHLIAEFYHTLSWDRKLHFIENLRKLSLRTRNLDSRLLVFDAKNITSLQGSLAQTSRLLIRSLFPDASISEISSHLKRHHLIAPLRADYLIVVNPKLQSEPTFLNLIEEIKSRPDRSVFVTNSNKQWIFPDSSTDQTASNRFRVNQVLWLDCSIPPSKTVLSYQNYSRDFVFVKLCSNQNISLDWPQLLEAQRFNAKKLFHRFSYLQIDQKSLELAISLYGDYLNHPKYWARWLGWKKLTPIGSHQGYAPIGVIQAIRQYRWPL